MKPGTRSYGPATLSVAIPRALPKRMQAKVRELVGVYVPEEHRRQGLASELMNRTAREADRSGTALLLSLDEEPLQAFYARFGFVTLQTAPALMMLREARH